jgi:hypothetical protein
MKQTDREGVNAVERVFVKELGWIFREQTIGDWGIDAHVEVANEKEPSGRLLALQIKSGKSFLKGKQETSSSTASGGTCGIGSITRFLSSH